jgi:hypothetical protein
VTNDPVLIADTVEDATPQRKARWTRVVVAFPHDRGSGLTVLIDPCLSSSTRHYRRMAT